MRKSSHPYMAGLYLGGKHFCGGSLISPRHVLTAGHYLAQLSASQTRSLLVRLGRHHVYQSQPDEVTRRVTKVSIHKGFRAAPHFYNDIAVLRLDRDVPYSFSIHPVTLPGAVAELTGKTGLVLGWGRIREVIEVEKMKNGKKRIRNDPIIRPEM